MADLMGIGSIMSGGASALGGVAGLLGSIGAGKRMRRNMEFQAKTQYKYQQKAAEAEFARQKEFWNMNNEYNSPEANRQRLEEAGMLGASMFEGGAAGAPATMPDAGTPSGPSVSLPSANPGIDAAASAVQVAQGLANIGLTEAKTRESEQHTTYEDAQTRYTTGLTQLQGIQASNIEADAAYKRSLEKYQNITNFILDSTKDSKVELSKLQVDELTEQIDLLKQQWIKVANDNSLFPQQRQTLIAQYQNIVADTAYLNAKTLTERYVQGMTAQQTQYLYELATQLAMDNDVQQGFLYGTQTSEEFNRIFGKNTVSGKDISIFRQTVAFLGEYYGAELAKQLDADFSDSKKREVALATAKLLGSMALLSGGVMIGNAAGNVARNVPTIYGPNGKPAVWMK